MIHELKCWPVYFRPLLTGEKNFEVRVNDRAYQKGDTLRLREFYPPPKQLGGWPSEGYTGAEARREITFVLSDARFVKEGTVVLALKEVSE